MKSKFKKLLATALVLCLVLALLPAAAFADGGDDTPVDPQTGTKHYLKAEFVGTATGTTQAYFSGDTVDEDAGGFFAYSGDTITFSTWLLTPPSASDPGLYSIKAYKTGDKTTTFTPAPVGVEQYEFTMPEYDVTIEVEFRNKHTVTYDPDDVSVNSTSVMEGDWVIVTPNANMVGAALDYVWYQYEGQTQARLDKNLDGEYKFLMGTSNVTVGAEYTPIVPPTTEHYIDCADKITGGEIWSSANSAEAGDVVTIYVDPDWDWMTDDVYYKTTPDAGLIGGKASFNGYAANGDEIWSFVMPASNVWVYAEFKPYFPGHDYHAINVTSDGHCSVDVKNWAYCGEYVTINLSNFDAGYAFSYLKVDGVSVKPYGFNGYLSYTFKMPHKDVAIEVGTTSVSGKYYIATSYDSTLGGVEVWVNNNYVGNDWHQGSWADYNDTVSFKVKPYYSDDVVSVSVVGKRTGWNYSCDYNSYSGWYTFTMPNEDVTINVDFRSGVHKVYVDKVTDGKLTVSDDWAKYGQIVYITAVPDYGCTLSSLSVRTATGDSVRVYNAQKADTYYFYMPDQYVSVSAVFTGKYTSLPFNDVSYGDWYYDAVQFVYSKGIMDGVDYYKFAPNGTITRGMILTMLWRMAGEPFEMPVTSFTDVEIGRYYTTAVAWACRNGIADGMGESTFGPNDAITREELVTLMYRYAQYFGHSCIGTSIEGFADAGSVSDYAYNAMCWAYKAGVVTGTTGSRLNPQGTASRAEAAQMIMSFSSFLNT